MPANFHEVSFPLAIAFHSTGGPGRRTEIVTLGSGHEERNAVWAASRRRYDVGSGVRTLDDLAAVIAFFEARMGRLYGFRFKDFADCKSCAPAAMPSATDQGLGMGDGVTRVFQLRKAYADTAAAYVRDILKPVAGSVKVAVNGAALSGGFAVDAATGLVTFAGAPAIGAVLTAGFLFDTPVRFDSDTLSVNLAGFSAGEVASIPLVEILL
ncbi:MAG: DUF2460 domain-containing protein [Alphaproteobacteria bacterium]|nr:DUF2460 domain-containing protein [Alphaproteobacteria bacterium]